MTGPAVRHVILDRDGVLNREGDEPVATPADWQWETGAIDGLRLLAGADIAVSVATNQSAIAAGRVDAATVDELHRLLADELTGFGLRVVGVYSCPHGAADHCDCRKPLPGLVHQAIAASGIPAGATVLVGDDARDLDAGSAAGVAVRLVRTGKGADTEQRSPGIAAYDDLAAFARDLVG